MKSPKISILIANYNNGHFFKDCYDSLISQTEKDWEAIVVDDCSTDNSVEVIKTLISEDARFRFYQNEKNLGYQRTLIKAIELSTAEIFGRVDPDDALTIYALELSLKAHQENPKAGLVYSNFKIADENLRELSIHKGKQILELNEDYMNFRGEISHFATFKREIYNQTSGIDAFNKRAEDKDIYMKMCEVAQVKHIDEVMYLYRIHTGGASTNNNAERALFWHFVALMKMAERRNINIEDLFHQKLVRRYLFEIENRKVDLLKKNRWVKLGVKLGLVKNPILKS